jgi:hypothetical protein
MKPELKELIRDARKELRKAAGLPLSQEEQNEDLQKAAVTELRKFILSRLGVRLPDLLNGKVVWTENGPALILDAEDGHVFHMRKDGDSGGYLLFIIEGNVKREIARIESSDANFASHVLVAIDDAIPSTN